MAEVTLSANPPEDVLDYWNGKQLRPRFSYLDVWAEEHAFAHTVAGVTEARVLKEFQEAGALATARGMTFEQFRSEMRDRLTPRGWWGPRVVADPTGKDPDKVVDFSIPRRLEITFWSNMRSARAAGQWARAQRTKRMLPYFLYVETTARDPREEHLEWVGVILPVDHPWWRTHFPPNGWGCLCRARQITEFEARRLLGRPPGEGGVFYRKTAPEIVTKRHVNRRTGEVSDIPVGIDPGWHTNPGLARAETLMRSLRETMDDAGEAVARDQVAKLWASRTPETLMNLPQRVHMPVAVAPDLAATARARGSIVSVSNDTLRTKLGHTGRRLSDFAAIQELFDSARTIRDPRHANVWALFGRIGRQFVRLVLGKSADDYLYVRTLHPLGETPARMDALVRKLERGE
ncbi:hypothetical protein EJV44_04635 [Ancylobacter aquaticus]|nr:hypothetical protein EJV44_04635 [Ancylobacter aquaticus]